MRKLTYNVTESSKKLIGVGVNLLVNDNNNATPTNTILPFMKFKNSFITSTPPQNLIHLNLQLHLQ